MRSDVRRDFDQSVIALRTIVFPELQKHCPAFAGREVIVLGRDPGPLAHDLDAIAGIDAYQRSPGALRTIAARVQYVLPGRSYRTFTIRTSRPHQHTTTEFQKRLEQLAGRESGVLYPYWTIHAYLSLDGSVLYSVGVAKTSELYFWVARRLLQGEPFVSKTSPDGEGFFVVPWDQYRATGHAFFEYPSVRAAHARN